MNKNPQNHRLQKYENPPITTTEGLTHLGRVDTIYHSTDDELNYSPMAAGYVIRCLHMLHFSPSEQIPATENQTDLYKTYQTSQRTTTPRICTYSQKSKEKTKAQGKEDKQALQRVQKANGIGAL